MKRSSRNNRRRSNNSNGGNGIITGVLIGMILAVSALAVLMWYMSNQQTLFPQQQAKTNKTDEYQQRPQRPVTPPKTEIIRPQDNGVVPPLETAPVITTVESPTVTQPATTNTPNGEKIEQVEKVEKVEKNEKKEIVKKEEPKKVNDDVLGEFIRKKDQEKKQANQNDKDALGDFIAKIDQKKQPEKQSNTKQPTQTKKSQDDDELGNLIGHIEQKNKQTAKNTAQKSTFKPIVEGKSVIQAGSFATQEQAESQRAKLSMLGVSTHIETAVKDGKTYYRVRSSSIDTEQAYALKKRLAAQNTDSIVIPYR